MSVELIGTSTRFRHVIDAIALVGCVDSSVLLLGETGTGKELVARALHAASARSKQSFVAINCAAIPAPLMESELFGHERGAFTGAVAQTTGRFQAAHGGTLFLDEVGDLPLALQPKLLRALQEQHIERLGGGGRSLPADVRVIAATNQDLWAMVQARTFRADLYYRLNVLPITLPPLRERREDIPLLVAHFVRHFSARHRKQVARVPDELMAQLARRPWPGNVRELQNVIERAVVTSRDDVLHVPCTDAEPVPKLGPRTLADVERAHIIATLQETNWVVGGGRGAAARLGLPRTTLIAKMQRLGLQRGVQP